jgi:hypothetical protein
MVVRDSLFEGIALRLTQGEIMAHKKGVEDATTVEDQLVEEALAEGGGKTLPKVEATDERLTEEELKALSAAMSAGGQKDHPAIKGLEDCEQESAELRASIVELEAQRNELRRQLGAMKQDGKGAGRLQAEKEAQIKRLESQLDVCLGGRQRLERALADCEKALHAPKVVQTQKAHADCGCTDKGKSDVSATDTAALLDRIARIARLERRELDEAKVRQRVNAQIASNAQAEEEIEQKAQESLKQKVKEEIKRKGADQVPPPGDSKSKGPRVSCCCWIALLLGLLALLVGGLLWWALAHHDSPAEPPTTTETVVTPPIPTENPCGGVRDTSRDDEQDGRLGAHERRIGALETAPAPTPAPPVSACKFGTCQTCVDWTVARLTEPSNPTSGLVTAGLVTLADVRADAQHACQQATCCP